MNPIEQLMQTSGSSLSPAIAGLLGLAPSATQGSTATSPQFLEALQNLQAVDTVKASNALAGTNFTVPAAELIAGLGITLPTDTNALPAQFNIAATIQAGAPEKAAIESVAATNLASDALSSVGLQLVQLDGLVPNLQAGSETLSSSQLQADASRATQIPLASQAALEELGFKLEQLPALPSSAEIAATVPANVSSSGRLMPFDAVEGLLSAAAQQTSAQPSPLTATEGGGVAATAQQMLPSSLANQAASTLSAGTPQAGSDTQSGSQEFAASGLASSMNGKAAQSLQAMSEVAETEKHQAARINAALEQTAQNQRFSGTSQDEAVTEGNIVAAAKQAQVSNVTGAPGSASKDKNGQNVSSANNPARNYAATRMSPVAETVVDHFKEALSPKAVEPAMARPDVPTAYLMPQTAKEAALPLTPERLAGLGDISAAQTVASGLSGMKGESSFMAGMGLLGGKVNPEFARQIGQQLNLHVAKAVNGGQQDFTLRLNPAELGNVRVKMSFLEDGRVQAQVMVERAETLELLQKDTRGLERALGAGGHKADGGIQFSLDTNDQQSAGRAFAEALQQEKMRDELASRSTPGTCDADLTGTPTSEEAIPLEEILAKADIESGLDIRV